MPLSATASSGLATLYSTSTAAPHRVFCTAAAAAAATVVFVIGATIFILAIAANHPTAATTLCGSYNYT